MTQPADTRRDCVDPISTDVVKWPDKAAEEYLHRGWWRNRDLGQEIRTVADRHPQAPAIIDGNRRFTYDELVQRADAAATRLIDTHGLNPGDRIVIQLANSWQFVVLTLACLRAGIAPVMALPAHRRHELQYLVEHSQAAAIAVPGELRGFDHDHLAAQLVDACPSLQVVLTTTSTPIGSLVALDGVCDPPSQINADVDQTRWDTNRPDPRSVAVFLLSGGTTGLPKLIARTHNDYSYNARASAQLCGFTPDTVYLVSLPISHNFPLACPGVLGTLLTGGRVVLLNSPEPERAFATIAAEGVTVTALVPAVAQRWISHARQVGADQLRSLMLLQVGGARIADETARQIRPILGCTLQQAFGMAEGLLNYTRLDDPDDVVCTTQGRPLSPGDEIRVVDDLGLDVAVGAAGSLLTRGPYTPRGYYRAPEQNLRAFTPDGWYRSGDIVRLRSDGNLVVEGREKDMINRGGEKISAEEVENLVYRLPQVAQVAAVAMPDPDLGERVCVYVVSTPDFAVTLEHIHAAMADAGVSRYKWPEHLEVVPELPVTKVGKVDKSALRDRAKAGRILTKEKGKMS